MPKAERYDSYGERGDPGSEREPNVRVTAQESPDVGHTDSVAAATLGIKTASLAARRPWVC